jgi:hypothetical protein
MSLTPLDEQRRERSEAARDGASPESLRSRLRARISDVLARVPVANRLIGTESDRAVETVATAPTRSPDHTTRVVVDGLPQRDTPFVTPVCQTRDQNPAELDAAETEDGLTLSLGDNPEATITSDTYQQVER